jgi:uncharacterized protein (TIGR03067 family)
MRSARLFSTIGGLLAVLVATGAPAQDAGNIQGAWTVVSAERDAKSTAEVAGHRLTFSGDMFTIQHEGHALYRGTYSVDPSRKPAPIDFLHTEGTLKGKTWKGIYRLDGDALRICDNAPNMAKPRPTQFAAKSGSGYICIVFKRATG